MQHDASPTFDSAMVCDRLVDAHIQLVEDKAVEVKMKTVRMFHPVPCGLPVSSSSTSVQQKASWKLAKAGYLCRSTCHRVLATDDGCISELTMHPAGGDRVYLGQSSCDGEDR